MILHTPRTRTVVALAVGLPLLLGGVASPAAARVVTADPGSDLLSQQYRPAVHFTPTENWMNDPNGLVYHDGTYHLFFQHNPRGTVWGNMSWGHATSTDLVHWTQQPLAIPQTFDANGVAIEDIFSGSVVMDEQNTSGLGTAQNPPMIAIYTSAYTGSHPTLAGRQAQSIAYSLDEGQTWTKYAGNPVLDRGSANFRDPKVFRYSGPAGDYWVMVAVEATEHRVLLYRSDDLRSWTYLSDFGPANAVSGIWECPDLFPLAVDGDADDVRWVLVVNLNPGAVNGGSGGQYFVGDFDGTTFTSQSTVGSDALPAGDLLWGFDDGTYQGWTVGNEPGNWKDGPWGSAPATGSIDGQQTVTGFVGTGLVNGFLDGDWPLGTLESPAFTVTSDYLNFLVGGGRHPHVDGGQTGNEPPAGRTVFDFELPDGTTLADSGWDLTGDFATDPARNPSTAGGEYYLGAKRINTWEGGPRGDDNVGTMTSPSFVLDGSWVSFLLGGGSRTDGSLQVELLVDGQVVRSQTGPEAGDLRWNSWDVSDLAGRSAQIRVVDQATGGWGHLTLDQVVVGDEKSLPRSSETTVNLVVDGQVVRSATGADSESLDWTSWDVSQYQGRSATIRVVDNNRGGWGHILLDQVMAADTPAVTRAESYDWLDWGRDYYAAVSFGGVPDGRRVMLGWMNNWDYANAIPTSTWRSAMALPREVTLTATPQGPRLVQHVVDEVGVLAGAATHTETATSIPAGTRSLPVGGDVLRIDAVLRPGDADSFGLRVLGDDDSGTLIGYDTSTGRLFVDRTDSGDVGFSGLFPSVDDAPVALADGRLALTIYVDRASVEVFTADGRTTLTDQVFPDAGATQLALWAQGGQAEVEQLTVTPLAPAMFVTAPGAPTAAIAALAGDTSVAVTWAAPASDGGAPLTGYRVYEAGGTAPVCSTAAGATTCTVVGLALGSTHRYEVSALSSAGEGARSAPTAVVTTPEVSSADGATGRPAPSFLWSDHGWDGVRDGDYRVSVQTLWGQNASLVKFYENGVLVSTQRPVPHSPAPQSVHLDVRGKANGTYRYTAVLVNSRGATWALPLTVKVTDALPARPVLTADNADGDGRYTVRATLLWGTNATSYRFYENGRLVGQGSLVAATPRPQVATLPVQGKARGSYTYTVEFTNAQGSTTSKPLTVSVKR